jgi:hypothetical protein
LFAVQWASEDHRLEDQGRAVAEEAMIQPEKDCRNLNASDMHRHPAIRAVLPIVFAIAGLLDDPLAFLEVLSPGQHIGTGDQLVVGAKDEEPGPVLTVAPVEGHQWMISPSAMSSSLIAAKSTMQCHIMP